MLIFEFGIDRIKNRKKLYAYFEFLLKFYYLFDIFYALSPCTAIPILKEGLEEFFNNVSKRPYRYTDILGIPKRLNDVGKLLGKIRMLKPIKTSYKVV